MAKVKKQKKIWLPILAPEMFHKVEVGETLINADTPSNNLVSRILEVPLSDLTNNISDVYSYLRLRITKVEGGKAYTQLEGFYILPAFVKSLARKKREVIKIVKDIEGKTKGENKIRIKMLIITPDISREKESAIRKEAEKVIDEALKGKSIDEIIDIVIKKEIVKSIIDKVKKIAPVQKLEIYKIEQKKK